MHSDRCFRGNGELVSKGVKTKGREGETKKYTERETKIENEVGKEVCWKHPVGSKIKWI